MASRCADINVRVALLTARLSEKPPLEPKRALALQDKAGFKREPLGEATCITEMMLLMGCWRLNNFTDSPCSSEIRAFSNCFSKTKTTVQVKSPSPSEEILRGANLMGFWGERKGGKRS